MNLFDKNNGAVMVETLAPSMTDFIRGFASGEGLHVRLFGAKHAKGQSRAVAERFSEFSPEGVQVLRNPELAVA